MNIYVSTNLYTPDKLYKIFSLMDKIDNKNIGIEIFPEWQNGQFIDTIRNNIDKLKKYSISLHGPYYGTEHSKKKGTMGYEISKEYFVSTFELSQQLNGKHIVYHHNNCCIDNEDREEIIKNSSENLIELNKMAESYEQKIVVENAGVIYLNNMLFNEEQFIHMAKSIDNKILIDIGHAFANKWDLDNVMSQLKHKISSYHIHNNNGVEDNHNRIRNGKLNIEEFFESYKKHTPNADLILEYSKNSAEDVDGIIDDVKYVENIL